MYGDQMLGGEECYEMGSPVLLLSVQVECGPFGIWQPNGEHTDGKTYNLSG